MKKGSKGCQRWLLRQNNASRHFLRQPFSIEQDDCSHPPQRIFCIDPGEICQVLSLHCLKTTASWWAALQKGLRLRASFTTSWKQLQNEVEQSGAWLLANLGVGDAQQMQDEISFFWDVQLFWVCDWLLVFWMYLVLWKIRVFLYLGDGFQYFLFSLPGEDSHSGPNIFQMGWFDSTTN